MFEPTSRYYGLETATLTLPDGRVVSYVRRRFLPQGERIPLLGLVTVEEGDRLDLIAGQTVGDPEQYWRICDANDALHPADLTARIGAVLRIPQPYLPDGEGGSGP